MTSLSPYLSIKEVAEILAVSESTIRSMIRAKELPAIRTGPTKRTVRIARSDFEAYLAHARTVPTASGDSGVMSS